MNLFRKPPQSTTLDLGDLTVEIQRKRVKNLNLRVHVPDGSVRISAPWYARMDDIRNFALSKLDWVRKQRLRIQEQKPEPALEGLGASLPLWGIQYPLHVEERPGAPSIVFESDQVVVGVRPGTTIARRQRLIESWYRKEIEAELPALVSRWAGELGVRPHRFDIRKMTSRWGTCQPSTGTIRLNTELAKKLRECLTYVVVHELVHLIEASHGPRFVQLMNRHLPQWPDLRKQLNQLPVLD